MLSVQEKKESKTNEKERKLWVKVIKTTVKTHVKKSGNKKEILQINKRNN